MNDKSGDNDNENETNNNEKSGRQQPVPHEFLINKFTVEGGMSGVSAYRNGSNNPLNHSNDCVNKKNKPLNK